MRNSPLADQRLREEQEKTRLARHQQLIDNVMNYQRTLEDEEKLQRMKKLTKKQIQMRYTNSKQNGGYVFQKNGEDESEEEDSSDLQVLNCKFYNLNLQNQNREASESLQKSNTNKRFKSLEQADVGIRSEKVLKGFNKNIVNKIIKGQQKCKLQLEPNSTLKRSTTMRQNPSKLLLPSLNNNFHKLKTLKSEGIQSFREIISHKLATESNSPVKSRAHYFQPMTLSMRKIMQSRKQK